MDFAQAHASKLRQPVGTQWSQDASGAQLPSILPSLPEEGAARAQSGFSELGAKSEGDPDLCSVCMDRKIQTVFLECGHLACCKECSKRLRDCPICRRPISRVVLIYRA
ncbi:zinc finger, C3HC4 type (RING finger) domain containing protein [Acanthamoeba castellanii str. Neff]|uniref:Zinc finger, C3HC4 type (RING finger) domain containing protein n=1 Tax=Acanthamoeba castellanii (strain ATCC 30010 / Neff) TaxID=1257118 RepID=L8H9Z9_ACACF|nr:zinc finger, C3HC4 type (RING finger) domain containing protein [Acanthamoeba castellanii str. Neff]ELR21538.1 zinc finger, C3HC4 type (RING finger) domain containing protein [Acanthamoeba castellanii str. Neff]